MEIKNPEGELDVRTLIPIERHKLLLQLFGELPAGADFVFINDHDPIPLYYEFRSIYGDVVGWEYLNKGGREWKVRVSRTAISTGKQSAGISTTMDLRKVDPKDWKHVVFHRYGMMEQGDIMELISDVVPAEIKEIFDRKFEGQFSWTYRKEVPDEYVVHLEKKTESGLGDDGFMVVSEFDIRPYEPAERHEMFYKAFAGIKAGEAFVFTNDHDPRPLYYQMKSESGEPFKWEYLEEGPEVWKVRVRKVSAH